MKYKIPSIDEAIISDGSLLGEKIITLIPAPGEGKMISLCEDGIHYEILNVEQ